MTTRVVWKLRSQIELSRRTASLEPVFCIKKHAARANEVLGEPRGGAAAYELLVYRVNPGGVPPLSATKS